METNNLKKTFIELAKEYKEKMQGRIAQKELVSTGALKDSIKTEVAEDGFSIVSDKKYAHLLGNFGYLKSWRKPNPFKLAEWAKMKRMQPRDRKGRFGSYKTMGFILANSINKKGTAKRFGYRGSRIIYDTNREMESKMKGEISEAFKLDLMNGMRQDFKFDNK
tara:strand:+ start:1321 stop:1812 length:492 start_codon:yes stop_codon:yes gene_type:complete